MLLHVLFFFFLKWQCFCDTKKTLSNAVTPLTPLNENEAIQPYDAESALELMYQRVNALPNFCEIPNNSPECFALDVKKRSQKAMEVPLDLGKFTCRYCLLILHTYASCRGIVSVDSEMHWRGWICICVPS